LGAALIGSAILIGSAGSPLAAGPAAPSLTDPPTHISAGVTGQICIVNQVGVARPGAAKSPYEAITRYVKASHLSWPTGGWSIPKGEPYTQAFGITLDHDGVLPEVTVQKASDGTWTVTGVCGPTTAQ
jgi:hypothetical protein